MLIRLWKEIKLNIVTKKETANTPVKCQSIIYQHPKNRRIHKLLTLVLKSIFLHSGQRVGSCGATKKKRFLLSLETMPTKLESFQYITQRNITTKKCKSDTISWRDLMSDLKFLEKANSKKWRIKIVFCYMKLSHLLSSKCFDTVNFLLST